MFSGPWNPRYVPSIDLRYQWKVVIMNDRNTQKQVRMPRLTFKVTVKPCSVTTCICALDPPILWNVSKHGNVWHYWQINFLPLHEIRNTFSLFVAPKKTGAIQEWDFPFQIPNHTRTQSWGQDVKPHGCKVLFPPHAEFLPQHLWLADIWAPLESVWKTKITFTNPKGLFPNL